VPHPLFERHAATIERALAAIADRGYWSAYSESPSPKVYGEGAADAGKAAFDALRDKPFPLEQPGTVGSVGRERSPYGFPLGITYPKPDLDALFAAVANGSTRMAQRRGPTRGSASAPRSCIDQPRQLSLRERGDAHDGTGVHDGVPGRRPARAGPRSRSHRLRLGGNEADSRARLLGEAAGQERAAEDGKAFPDRAARSSGS
jgi:hypothetical protein